MIPLMNKYFGKSAASIFGIGLLFVALIFAPMASTAQNTKASNSQTANITLAAAPQANPVPAGYSTETAQNSALGKAGQFARDDLNNIGIIIYYGSGNGATPEQAGDYVLNKLNKRLEERVKQDPSFNPSNIDAAYFIQHLDPDAREGIVVGFLMGGQGIKKDIREAVTNNVLDDVLDKRATSARLLNNTRPQ